MERTWRRLSDRREVNLESYLKEWISNNPGSRIYIGCDSQNHGSKTVYATVVVMHYATGGAHVIYEKQTLPRIRTKKPDQDLFIRLWKEVEFSIELASAFEEYGMEKPDYVDIDLNPDPVYRSNVLLREAVGLIESMGLKLRYKHKSPWAISIADTICNPKKSRGKSKAKGF